MRRMYSDAWPSVVIESMGMPVCRSGGRSFSKSRKCFTWLCSKELFESGRFGW